MGAVENSRGGKFFLLQPDMLTSLSYQPEPASKKGKGKAPNTGAPAPGTPLPDADDAATVTGVTVATAAIPSIPVTTIGDISTDVATGADTTAPAAAKLRTLLQVGPCQIVFKCEYLNH